MSFQRRAIRVATGCVTAAIVTAAGLQAQSAPPKPGQPNDDAGRDARARCRSIRRRPTTSSASTTR